MKKQAFVTGPPEWRLRESAGPHGFVTRQVFEDESGALLEWTSRRHRKGLGLRVVSDTATTAQVGLRDALAYHGLNWWIGWLFMIGSACFALGSTAFYGSHIQASIDGVTFFVGSLFFTGAALLQHIQTVTADQGIGGYAQSRPGSLLRLLLAPTRIDWWATAIQLAGTVAFNVTTLAALNDTLNVQQQQVRVWAPDAVGSACFLIASYLALAEVGHAALSWRPHDRGWRISALNMLGSILFGISAIASFILPDGELVSIEATNLFTFLGAICFLAGAWLLLPEAAESAMGDKVDR